MQKSKLRICIIGDTGGIHVRTRALAFIKRGYTINTITPRLCGLEELHERSPIRNSNPNTATYIFECYQLLRDCPGDIVHVHYACSLSAWIWLITASDKPLIVSVMGGDVLFSEQGNLPRMARWMTKQVMLRANAITAKSDHLAEALIAMGIPDNKIETIIWGVDPEHFKIRESTSLRKELGLSAADPIIFSPRILRPFYNILMIVEALPHILKKLPNTRLLISEYEADSLYREQLVSRAIELGVEGALIFCGKITYKKMPEYYSIADVAVGIPPSDGFPQTLLEAMACQTPNVVTNLKRYEALVQDNESAVFVELTPESIATGILCVLQDKAFAERLSQAGRAIVIEKANLADNVSRVEAIYQRLAGSRPVPMVSLWVRVSCLIIMCGIALRSMFRPSSTPQNEKA